MGRLKPPMPQRGDFSFGTGHLDHRRVPSAREVINRTLPILAQRTRKVSGKTVRSIFKESYSKRFRHFLKMTQDLLLPWVQMLLCRFRLGQPFLQSAERPSSTRIAG